jgi:hypothetical protein
LAGWQALCSSLCGSALGYLLAQYQRLSDSFVARQARADRETDRQTDRQTESRHTSLLTHAEKDRQLDAQPR